MKCQRFYRVVDFRWCLIFFPPVLWKAEKSISLHAIRMNTPMANEHPFQTLFETLGRVPAAHAESVNRQAYEILSDILSVPVEKTGRCILFRAPRAGHGKTHLLSRIQHQLGSAYEFIPLHAAFGCRIDAATVTDDTLRRLVRQLPASGGLTILDLVTRRLFASSLQPLVGSGEVPCQDREGALTALRTRPIETFDFHHPNAVTAHWARENFEVLGQRLSHELAERGGLPVREVAFWVESLFRFASAPLENSNRVRLLIEGVHAGTGAEMERLEALLGLLTLLVRVVLVADDLEGFSTDETAALRLASFLGTLRQSVERVDVILSLNQDIWQSAFVPRLSGGLADRLSEVVVELEPLNEKEMAALLDSRVPGLGNRVLERIDVGAAGTHARGLIRAAGMAWLKATAMDSTPPVAAALATSAEQPVVEQSIPVLAPVVAEPPVKIETPEPEPAPAPSPEPVAESPASTFTPEPLAQDAPPSWPAPDFTPAPLVETAPEPLAWQPPVESPFQVETPALAEVTAEPAGDIVVSEEPPVFNPEAVNSWNSPAYPVEPSPQPVAAEQVADSPFQVAEEPAFTSQPPAPVEWQPAPSVDSPFQIAASQPSPAPALEETTFTPAGWQEAPQQAFQPLQESPFQIADPVFQPEPPAPSFQPVQDSPFQVADQPFAPQAPAPSYQPVQESPFQMADQPFTSEPPALSFQPEPAFQPPAYPPETAFQPATEPAFQPQSAFQAAQEPAAETPPPSTADTDRVDDLLRQFRERYGRGSL